MKILLTSDSHYYNENLERILTKYKNNVDFCIHCGDSSLDENHPLMIQFDYVVQGNHDDYPYPLYATLSSILITHGHKYGVYKGYNNLIELCKEKEMHYCFHGHTHVPTIQVIDNIVFVNPGSLMMNRGSYGFGTYAIIDIYENSFDIQFYHHETDEIVSKDILQEGLELLEEFKQLEHRKK